MKLRTLLAVAVAAAFAVPFGALAQGTGGTTTAPAGSQADPSTATGSDRADSGMFNRLDKNKDGFISREEARGDAGISSRFDSLDKDRDGKLSPSELGGMEQSGSGSTSGSMSPSSPSSGGPAASGASGAPGSKTTGKQAE